MFMGFFCTSVVGFGALGVDVSYISMSKSQAQAVADAASHAAMITYRYSNASTVDGRVADARAAAEHIVEVNPVGLDGSADLASLQFGVFDPDTGQFQAGATPYNAAQADVERSAANALQLMLAPMLGQHTADISEGGVTAAASREVIVVVDRSCSMAWPWSDPGYRGVKQSLEVFSEYMVEHQVPEDRLGITSFSSNGDTWEPLTYIDGNEVHILDRWSSWGPCPSPDDPQYDYACQGGTYQHRGIDPAVSHLSGSTNRTAFQAIIVISDGNPSSSWAASQFLRATEDAWDEDIHVWTVAFGQNINHTLMEQATKGVGSYYPLPSSNGLEEVMLAIARSIPVTIAE
jgi:Flp pilus assembly protein TadG